MKSTDPALAGRTRRRIAVEWWATIILAAAATVAVWVIVGAGPEICALGFASASNCFAVHREQIGWIATGAICVSIAGYAAGTLLASPKIRQIVWIASLVMIVGSVAFALLMLV